MTYPGLFARGMRRAVTGMAVALGVYAALTGGALAQKSKDKKQEKDKAAASQQAPAGKGDKSDKANQADKNNPADKSTTADKAKQAAAPAAGAKPGQSAWVKLCEKAALQHKDKDGKDVKEEKNVCLTHHERLDGNTGMVLVSAAIRQVEGNNKQQLMVMVPLGMAIQPGLRAAVYSKELWEKAQKNEKVDEKLLKPVELKYSLCHPAGCTAEVEASKEIVESFKTGGGLMVLAMNAAAQPVAFPVPLEGFNTAHSGSPVDNKTYAQARGQLMQQIRQRHAELVKQHQAQQAQAGGKAPENQAQQPAPAQPAPAKK
jgi:invasion protein IalB